MELFEAVCDYTDVDLAANVVLVSILIMRSMSRNFPTYPLNSLFQGVEELELELQTDSDGLRKKLTKMKTTSERERPTQGVIVAVVPVAATSTVAASVDGPSRRRVVEFHRRRSLSHTGAAGTTRPVPLLPPLSPSSSLWPSPPLFDQVCKE